MNSVDGFTGLCVGVRPLSATPTEPAASPSFATAAPADPRLPGAQPPGETVDRRRWLAGGAILTVLAAAMVAMVLRWRRLAGRSVPRP